MESGCSYDECFTDSHCPSLSPCLCRSSARYAYYCHTKNDTCINASDCPAAKPPDPQDVTEEWFPICAYDTTQQRWGCDQSVCLPP
jgi:hypothetical protein